MSLRYFGCNCNINCCRYAYCDSAVKSILGDLASWKVNVPLVLFYDIACQYQVKITDPHRIPSIDREDIKFVIPGFHIYAHKFKCHVDYSPKSVSGIGLTAGEHTETLWSVIGRFGMKLRMMFLGKQQDYLNFILDRYSQKIIEDLRKNSFTLLVSVL